MVHTESALGGILHSAPLPKGANRDVVKEGTDRMLAEFFAKISRGELPFGWQGLPEAGIMHSAPLPEQHNIEMKNSTIVWLDVHGAAPKVGNIS